MMQQIEPSEIGKHPDLIEEAQKEMSHSDVLVCGKCQSVFLFIDLFKEHKANNCKRVSTFNHWWATKPKVWAYRLWKQTQVQQRQKNEVEDPWELYKTWMQLKESTRQSWLAAGEAIHSFERFDNGLLQETTVKITETLNPEKPVPRPSPVGQVVRRVVSHAQPILMLQPLQSRISRSEVIVISPKPVAARLINRTDPISKIIEKAAIEKILGMRNRGAEYLVKWESKPQTWEPASHLAQCKDLVRNFEVWWDKQMQKEVRSKSQKPSATSTPTAVVTTPLLLESSWEVAQQLGQSSMNRFKSDGPPLNESSRISQSQSGSDMMIGATVIRQVIGTKSPDVTTAAQKQQSGVFKKALPAHLVQNRPGEGEVHIVGSKNQIQSGIVRVGTARTPTMSAGDFTRVVPKASPVQQIHASPGTSPVVRTNQQNQQKALAQQIMKRSPRINLISPAAVVQRQPAHTSVPSQQVRKGATPVGHHALPASAGRVIAAENQDDDDDGILDPFPKDLPPPLETESSSPSPPLTLCPITGKILGQAEGEGQEAKGELSDQHQITKLLSNEDGTPVYITADDGTVYQVAGKNANGETILITTNAEDGQVCVLLPADQDLLAGMPGIRTTDASEAQLADTPQSVDAAVAEAAAAEESQEGDKTSQSGGNEVNQPLSIVIGGDSGGSQDDQVTAEIVQADEPSPDGTRNVVVMLPDGSLMSIELSQEQFQLLNVQQ